jgi:cytochrome bd-type quinol oxidase subunit 2
MKENSAQLANEENADIQLTIDRSAKQYLNETRKWSMFLSIMGFISIGVLLLFALFAGTFYSAVNNNLATGNMPFAPTILISILYIVFGVIYIFPTLYLYRFSIKLKVALTSNDSLSLTDAFKNQKSMYKFMGIFVIIILAFYVFSAIIGLIAMIS